MALIETRDLWKTYVMGSEEIHALRGRVDLRSNAANTSPSWGRRGPASRR